MPERLSAWRDKLGEKARKEPKFRFYSLYGLVTHPDTLKWAWVRVRRNHGAPGVDGVDFGDVEGAEGGIEQFLKALHEELTGKRYKAQAVRRPRPCAGFCVSACPTMASPYRAACG